MPAAKARPTFGLSGDASELGIPGLPTTGCGGAPKDEPFYQGKVAAARFFTRQVLPRLAAERAMAEATDNSLMDVPEAAF